VIAAALVAATSFALSSVSGVHSVAKLHSDTPRQTGSVCVTQPSGPVITVGPCTEIDHAWDLAQWTLPLKAGATSSTAPTSSTTIATTTTLPATSPGFSQSLNEVTATEYALWSRVASCEEGGWVGSSGVAYPDSLGINAANWYENGGTSDVSPDAQIIVAERIATRYVYAGYVPDQNGCSSW
jgi:hypothetical protein